MADLKGMKFRLSWLRAIEYFLLAYLISTVIAFGFWIIFANYQTIFWASRMAVMPLLFYYFTKLYLNRTQPRTHEGRRLAIFWIVMLVLFDFAIYIVVVRFKWTDVYVYAGQPWLVVSYLLSFLAPWIADARLKKLAKTA
jgi:hypothetical protein